MFEHPIRPSEHCGNRGFCCTMIGVMLIATGLTMVAVLFGQDIYHLLKYGADYRSVLNCQRPDVWFRPLWFTAFGICSLLGNERASSMLSLLYAGLYLFSRSGMYSVTHFPAYGLETIACLGLCLSESAGGIGKGTGASMIFAEIVSLILVSAEAFQQRYFINAVSIAVSSVYKLPLLLCFCFVYANTCCMSKDPSQKQLLRQRKGES